MKLARFALSVLVGLLISSAAHAQITVNLNSVIGVAGDNAADVDGVGNAVNFTGYALGSGATTLTATGSTGSSAFDFNSGFGDSMDRAIGSSAGAGNVFVDKYYDSSGTTGTGPLVLDTNNDGSSAGENPQLGFGMHGDTFITFDLDVIRTNNSLALGTPFTLSGSAGISFPGPFAATSGAIIVDSSERAVFDWTSGAGNMFSTYSLSLSGTDRYLTFIGLSGTDANNFYSYVGFANVQLMAVPEPSMLLLLGTGLATLLPAAVRRRRR